MVDDIAANPNDQLPSSSQLESKSPVDIKHGMRFTLEQMTGGPLPPPQALKEYELLVPGIGDRLLTMHEQRQVHQLELEKSEAEHRRANELLESHARTSASRNGPFFAIAAVSMLLILAGYIAFLGYPQTAGTVTTALVVGLALAFLTPRARSESAEPSSPGPPEPLKLPPTTRPPAKRKSGRK